MADFEVEQGCTYNPKFKISVNGKVPTEKDVGKINFRFGNLIKTFSDSSIPVIITV